MEKWGKKGKEEGKRGGERGRKGKGRGVVPHPKQKADCATGPSIMKVMKLYGCCGCSVDD